jgi:hypothetical protein
MKTFDEFEDEDDGLVYAEYDSVTYKFKPPTHDHSIYLTIVEDRVLGIIGIFVNCKQMEAFEFITALMVSYTRSLRRGEQLEVILKEMSEAFDPRGPYVIPKSGGIRVNGVVHHIGYLLEKYISSGGCDAN